MTACESEVSLDQKTLKWKVEMGWGYREREVKWGESDCSHHRCFILPLTPHTKWR